MSFIEMFLALATMEAQERMVERMIAESRWENCKPTYEERRFVAAMGMYMEQLQEREIQASKWN